jgi:hypothetical protein
MPEEKTQAYDQDYAVYYFDLLLCSCRDCVVSTLETKAEA